MVARSRIDSRRAHPFEPRPEVAGGRGEKDCIKWDALVADVHTDVPSPLHGDPGSVLHQGVGNVDLMIIAIDNGKGRVVYVGPTMSHYEFEAPNATRKTDEEWKTDLLDGKFPPRPDYTRNHLVPATERKPVAEGMRQHLLREATDMVDEYDPVWLRRARCYFLPAVQTSAAFSMARVSSELVFSG